MDPIIAWQQRGKHWHGANDDSYPYTCRCEEGEALRPDWADCNLLGCVRDGNPHTHYDPQDES
jgi:hypothetical protein